MHRSTLALLILVPALAAESADRPQRFLYAGVPGVGNATDHGGVGVLVFDMDRGYAFVKRIPTWSSPENRPAEGVRGIAAHAATGRLYVSTSRRLAAFDLATDRVVWEQNYGGKCCDRIAITPDGRTIYAPAAGAPTWYVVNAADGALVATIDKEGSPHNTLVSADGSRAYLENQGRVTPLLAVVDTKTNTVVKQIGPFDDMVRPFTINGKQTLVFANINNLLGFEVADLTTGRVLHRVAVEGLETKNSPVHGPPSPGIAMTAEQPQDRVPANPHPVPHRLERDEHPPA